MERVDNDLIKRKYDRHLEQEGEASRKGTEILLLIHLLYLLRDLLLRHLVIASRIFFADSHFLGAQTCLLYRCFLLFDGNGQQQQLHNKCKYKERKCVAARCFVEPAEK